MELNQNDRLIVNLETQATSLLPFSSHSAGPQSHCKPPTYLPLEIINISRFADSRDDLCVHAARNSCCFFGGIIFRTSYKVTESDTSDLIELLSARSLQHDTIFSSAVQLLQSMRSAPSCNRIAASRLLASCQSVRSDDHARWADVPATLDRIKSIYAARLALCELGDAVTAIPAACSPLRVTTHPPYLDADSLDSLSRDVIDGCLRVLESRPQWWTSYSNNRQNAILICQAARTEIEKEEMLDLYQSLADSTANLNKVLHDTIKNAAADSERHRAFVKTTEIMRSELLDELQRQNSRARDFLTAIANHAEAMMNSMLSNFAHVIRETTSSAAYLTEEVGRSSAEMSGLQDQLRRLYNETQTQRTELARAYEADLKLKNKLAATIQESLDSIASQGIMRLSERIVDIDGALDWLVQRLSEIQEQEVVISERLLIFETELAKSRSHAEELLETQTSQAQAMKSHLEAQKLLSDSARVAHGLLDKVTAKAANLETILNDAATHFNELPLLGISISPWAVCALLLCLMAMQNPKLTAILVLSGGLFLAAKLISTVTPMSFPAI